MRLLRRRVGKIGVTGGGVHRDVSDVDDVGGDGVGGSGNGDGECAKVNGV